MYFSWKAGWPLKQREVHRWVAYVEGGPPHACAVMPWGGDSYFMLGVAGCNYDASTIIYILFNSIHYMSISMNKCSEHSRLSLNITSQMLYITVLKDLHMYCTCYLYSLVISLVLMEKYATSKSIAAFFRLYLCLNFCKFFIVFTVWLEYLRVVVLKRKHLACTKSFCPC